MITFKSLGNYGRLGNQLFQIAATIGVAVKNGEQYIFPQWPYAEHLSVLTAPIQDFNLFKWYEYNEAAFTFDPKIFNIPNDKHVNLSGYFQSEKYFEHCKLQVKLAILNDKNLKRREILKKKYGINEDVCAMHIRLGDYLGLPDHYVNLTKTDYYVHAMMKLEKETRVRKYLVFSDDIGCCKNNMRGAAFTFSEEQSDFDDLLLMSACNYHITANSSFSWWGSWLADSKRTIAPKKWFGPAIPHDTKDLYRSDMILI